MMISPLLFAVLFLSTSAVNGQVQPPVANDNEIVALSGDVTPPSVVVNLAATDVSLAFPAPCSPLTLSPTINAMGVTLPTAPAGADHATIRYRPASSVTWTDGHDAVLTNNGKIVGSIFWLTPSTEYVVEVRGRSADNSVVSVNQCAATTRPNLPVNTVSRAIHVAAAAAPGGNGSLAAPYQTIQAAVNVTQPGDEVIVQPGIYHEGITFPRSGTVGAYIKVTGQPGAIMDGGDPTIEQNGLAWTPDPNYPNVYSTSIPTDFYADWYLSFDPIWRDTMHFYTYDSLADARAGVAHGGGAMSEGWFFDTDTNILTVRSLTDPDTHTWHIRSHDGAFRLTSRDYIWIEGLTMRYYPLAIYIPSGKNNVVRDNTIQAETGVLIDNSQQGRSAEGNLIETNYMFDAPLGEWGYDAVKGTRMEAGALVSWQGTGNIFRDNRIEQHFNGIFTGDAIETDVYRNFIRQLGDDGLELDGNAENVRAWGNAVDDINSAISLAPTTVGPVWAIYNRFTQFLGRAFKIGGGLTGGYDFLYHNTVWSSLTNAAGTQQVTDDTNKIVFRNNVLYGDPAIRWTQ
ncbi:MAG: right-handed parallel beta-helix repeat-containing protein, partial [Candidatus Kerfeldbacteria bacterium]|nr:right-handed parallel beta-helix repeat-containing protein [Candidatus Kerfeldbacteria bacterium]